MTQVSAKPSSPATNRNLPLPRIHARLSLFFPSAFIGGCLIALAAAFSIPPLPAWAASGPFADFNGSWTGNGTVRAGNNAPERIRCVANYRPRGSSQREVDLQLRCASDSYNFDLVGQFSANANNEITGQWTERTRNTGGIAIGSGSGERLDVHVESAGFAAELALVTRNRRQSITIDSHGGGQIVKASIALSRN
jgi:hypothetical protein